MERFDVIQVGAGHNGLIVAAYLAKAGLSVCVLEKQAAVGGGVISRENSAPGFKDDQGSIVHAMIHANPVIVNDELKLFKNYGLKYVYPERAATALFPNGKVLSFYKDLDKTCEAVSKFSQKDAEAYRGFYNWALSYTEIMARGLFNPPVPASAMLAALEQSEEGREMIRVNQTSVKVLIDEWFECEEVKVMLARFTADMGISFDQMGTGAVFLQFLPMMHKIGMPLCVGGSGALSLSLVRCIEDHGGVIRVSCGVKKYLTQNGECVGVVTEDGEEIRAKRLVSSNLHVKQYQPMIDDPLPAEFIKGANRVREGGFGFFKIDLALHNAIDWKEKEANEAVFVYPLPTNSYAELLEWFQKLSAGFVYADNPELCNQTVFDPTRAPANKHTVWCLHYANSHPGGERIEKWDELKEKVAEDILNVIRSRSTNMGEENIIGKHITTPMDFQRMNDSWIDGEAMQIGHWNDQIMQSRPFPGYYNYRSPIKNLYMCGPGCYPSANVNGGGRITAMVILEDLGINFESLVK